MSYITNADIENRMGTTAYVALTDDDSDEVADTPRVDEFRLGAEGEADSYLATRYQTPVDLSAHPELSAVLKSFVLDLVEYRMHGRRPPVPVDIVRRHAEAVAWFTRIATGAAHLPAATPLKSDASRPPLAETFGPPRVFQRDQADDA